MVESAIQVIQTASRHDEDKAYLGWYNISIHPLDAAYLGPAQGGSRLSKVVLTPLSPSTPPWGSGGIPKEDEILLSLLSLFLVYPNVSYQFICMNNQNWLLSTQRNNGSTSSYLLAETTWKTNFGRSLQSHTFNHYPTLAVTGEGWNDRLVNPKLCLPAQLPLHHKGLVECQHCFWRCPKMTCASQAPFSILIHEPGHQTLELLQSTNLIPTQRSHSFIHSFSANQSQVTMLQARQGNLEDLISSTFSSSSQGILMLS